MTTRHSTRPTWFRQHSSAPSMTSPLLQRLCEEWAALNADPDASDAVERWSRDYASLHGCVTPGDVVDLIDMQTTDAQDQALIALLSLLHSGEQLAGRVILQAMLPAIVGLSRRTTPPRGRTGHEEHLQDAIAQFWTVICRPRTPSRGVWARLKLDTLHQLTRHLHHNNDAWESHTDLVEETTAIADVESAASPMSGPSPDGDIYDLIVSARQSAVISAADAQFLADVFLSPNHETTLSHAARRLALQPAAVRQRCGRIRDRIVAATLDEHHRTHRQPRRARAS